MLDWEGERALVIMTVSFGVGFHVCKHLVKLPQLFGFCNDAHILHMHGSQCDM